MLDWTLINSDPTNADATLAVEEFLGHISQVIYRPWNCSHKSFRSFCDDWLFKQFAPNSKVLDIGFADHTCNPESEEWKHGKLRERFSDCTGIDVNEERVRALMAKTGMVNLLAADFASNPVLPHRNYEAIFAGDVIEHLSSPASLLSFIQARLSIHGPAIITTPNCLGRHLRRALQVGTAMDNLEHTCWISPFQMNELCRREALRLVNVIYFREGKKRLVLNKIIPSLKQKEFKRRDLWSNEYAYIISRHPEMSTCT